MKPTGAARSSVCKGTLYVQKYYSNQRQISYYCSVCFFTDYTFVKSIKKQHNKIYLNGPFVLNKSSVSLQTALTILFGAATVGLAAYIIYKQVMYVRFDVVLVQFFTSHCRLQTVTLMFVSMSQSDLQIINGCQIFRSQF